MYTRRHTTTLPAGLLPHPPNPQQLTSCSPLLPLLLLAPAAPRLSTIATYSSNQAARQRTAALCKAATVASRRQGLGVCACVHAYADTRYVNAANDCHM